MRLETSKTSKTERKAQKMYRDVEYWTEKADMMVDDYAEKLRDLMTEAEIDKMCQRLGRTADEYYRGILSTKQADVMEEMTARELTESMLEEAITARLKNLLPDEEEEEISEEQIADMLDWYQNNH